MRSLNTGFLISSLSRRQILQKLDFQFKAVGIDTRKDLKNKVFFAIKGDRFDGHDFLSSALDKGAKAFIVSDLEKSRFLLEHKNISLLLVPDTLTALTDLARAWRKELELQVIGITGSSGKTSVCSFTKILLSDLSPFVSPKSYNNVIGVSLSLLGVQKKGAVLIQEIGTNQPGEIAFLTDLCQPDISVLTMVGASHLEGLKSLAGVAEEKQNIYLKSPSAIWIFNRDNPWTKSIADKLCQLRTESMLSSKQNERSDLDFSFKKKDFADLNDFSKKNETDALSAFLVESRSDNLRPSAKEKLDNFTIFSEEKKVVDLKSDPSSLLEKEFSDRGYSLAKKGLGLFSFSSKEPEVDVSFKFIKQEKDYLRLEGQIAGFESTAQVPLFGKESLENLMCASTIALAMGVSPQRIWERLPKCRSPKGRQESFFLKEKELSICFDAYNANPSSMEFFLNYCEQSARTENRFLILGDMKELGAHSKKYHRQLALNKILLSSRVVFFVGEQSSLIEEELKKNQYQGVFKSFKSYSEELSSLVKKHWQKGDFIGIKASRSLALERLFFDLTGKKIF